MTTMSILFPVPDAASQRHSSRKLFRQRLRLQKETATDEGLEHYPEAGSSANIGIMLVKPAANPMVKVSTAASLLLGSSLLWRGGPSACC